MDVPQVIQRARECQLKGDLAQARALCESILARHADHPLALLLLGIIWSQAGRVDVAIAYTQKAAVLAPNDANAHSNLARFYCDAKQYALAVSSGREAVRLAPGSPGAYFNLAVALHSMGMIEEAQRAYRQALELDPSLDQAACNLCAMLKDAGQIENAVAYTRHALRKASHLPHAHSALLYAIHFHPQIGPQELHREHHRWNQRYAASLNTTPILHENTRQPDRRLRVGYVSPNFSRHVVGLNLLPLFRHYNRHAFEFICYSSNADDDDVTQELRSAADGWCDSRRLNDEQLAERLRQDRIDIAVDLTLHLAGSRLLAFARKPVPVQVTFAGYPGTTGLDTMDYRLSDPYLDPPNMFDGCYAEKTVRLAHSFWCYQPGSAPPVAPPPSVSNGHVTFGFLNAFSKINSHMIRLWAAILNRVTVSHFMLLTRPGESADRLADAMASFGISRNRLTFSTPRPHDQYMQLYQHIDISLDSVPYNGHTTSLDSLWMGVPVITLVGQTVVGRAGYSHLMNLGLPECIAHSDEQYVDLALALARDDTRRMNLRATLRDRMRASPLTDAPAFALQIEAAYRAMWQNWCNH